MNRESENGCKLAGMDIMFNWNWEKMTARVHAKAVTKNIVCPVKFFSREGTERTVYKIKIIIVAINNAVSYTHLTLPTN